MKSSRGGELIKLRTPAGIVWCDAELAEFIEGMCGRYADLIPREELVSVIWSPIPADPQLVYSIDRITRNGGTVAAICVHPPWWNLTAAERQEEFVIALQLERWWREGRAEIGESGLILRMAEGTFSGAAATEYLERHARSLQAR